MSGVEDGQGLQCSCAMQLSVQGSEVIASLSVLLA